jgi:hypothetical protein
VLTGPFGYTYDIDARQPLFSSSSYLIQPFKLPVGQAQGWDMAKVCLRRLTGNDALDAQLASVRPNDVYTPASWVQFLPSNNFNLKVTSVDLGGARFTLSCSDQQGPLFDWWLMVTKKIVDFTGHDNHEHYVGVASVNVDPTNQQLVATLDNALAPGTYNLRLVERQSAQLDEDSAKTLPLWQSLFANQTSDAPARLTRVSVPYAYTWAPAQATAGTR